MSIYNLSQISVIIATFFIGLTYFKKDKKSIILLCIIYCVFYGIHYLLLNAITGFLMILISIVRNIYFYKNAKLYSKNENSTLIILFVITIIFGLFSYQDLFSIFSIVASLLSTYSVWQDNVMVYKIIGVVVSICFITYSIHINSFFAIATESVLLLLELVGIIKMYRSIKVREQLRRINC